MSVRGEWCERMGTSNTAFRTSTLDSSAPPPRCFVRSSPHTEGERRLHVLCGALSCGTRALIHVSRTSRACATCILATHQQPEDGRSCICSSPSARTYESRVRGAFIVEFTARGTTIPSTVSRAASAPSRMSRRGRLDRLGGYGRHGHEGCTIRHRGDVHPVNRIAEGRHCTRTHRRALAIRFGQNRTVLSSSRHLDPPCARVCTHQFAVSVRCARRRCPLVCLLLLSIVRELRLRVSDSLAGRASSVPFRSQVHA
jgi:hypothetical protein